jgi:hypothetical protein
MKKNKANGPPAGEPWVWQSRALRSSDAWRSQSKNCRRLIDFLFLELMNKGGTSNGKLKAPRRQLEDFGIGARHITAAIAEAEELGLVGCYRGGMRVANTYAFTWLDLDDGTPASNRWRTYRNPRLKPLSRPKAKNLTSEGKSALTSEGKSDGRNLTAQGKSDRAKRLVSEGKHPSRSSYQDGFHSLGSFRPAATVVDGEQGADVVRLPRGKPQ